MRKTYSLGFLIASLLLIAAVSPNAKPLNTPGAYDLIAAVNALRANHGLRALEVDGSLMAAAKVQSDYLASIGGTNISDGHRGAGGTYAYDRAAAAGYPLPQGVDVVECLAWANSSQSLDYIINVIWADADHMNIMLHQYGKHVGAGVTEKDGNVYYILDVSTIWGASTGNGANTTPVNVPTQSTTAQVVPVIVSTPKADGSIYHVVQANQALWSIAIAYGITIDQLRQLNNFAANFTNIQVGESILIRAAYTPTAQPSATPTLRQPTRTPVPAQVIETLQIPPTETALPKPAFLGGVDKTTAGLILVLLCGIGLVLLIIGALQKRNK
jgi:LysM repeat protein